MFGMLFGSVARSLTNRGVSGLIEKALLPAALFVGVVGTSLNALKKLER